jgi:hypothetical protein
LVDYIILEFLFTPLFLQEGVGVRDGFTEQFGLALSLFSKGMGFFVFALRLTAYASR